MKIERAILYTPGGFKEFIVGIYGVIKIETHIFSSGGIYLEIHYKDEVTAFFNSQFSVIEK